MCTARNALGRQITRVFTQIFGDEFAAKWAAHSWVDEPTKIVASPNCGVLFLGFEDEINEKRRGFLIPADEALELAEVLKLHAEMAIQLGGNDV